MENTDADRQSSSTRRVAGSSDSNASFILNCLTNLMQNSNPLTFRKIPATLAIAAVGMTCLFGASQAKAQSFGNPSFAQQLAPRVDEIEKQRVFRPTRPTANSLTSISSEFNRLRTEPKPESQFPRATPAPRQTTQSQTTQSVSQSAADIEQRFAAAKQRYAEANPVLPESKWYPVGASNDPLTDNGFQTKVADSAGSKNLLPPTVVVRPSVAYPDHRNECVVEIGEIKSTNDVSLKVAIPDSVTMIEVVPNRSSSAARNFRIKMEQGVQPEQETGQHEPVNHLPQSEHQTEQHKPVPQTKVASNPTRPPADQDAHSIRGYSRNPFFEKKSPKEDTRLAETRQTNTRQTEIQKTETRQTEARNPTQFSAPTAWSTSPTKTKPSREVKSFPSQAYRSNGVGVRDFLRRTSHLSLTETPQPEELQELSFEPEPQAAQFAHGVLPARPVVAAQIVGPASVDIGQTADYMVAIVNPMNSLNEDLEIELDVPKGLKIVLLDRPAEFDKRKRTLNWKLDQIQPGEEVRLQYRVKSIHKGKHRQRVTVRINEQLLDTHEILTRSELNLNVDATELPFE